MKKFLLYSVLILILLFCIAILTPTGAWVFFAIVSTGGGNALLAIAALFAIVIIINIPFPEQIIWIRKLLCAVIIAATAFIVAMSLDFGGNLYGEWELVQDARINSFRIADSQNFRLSLGIDGSAAMINLDQEVTEEVNWRRSEAGTRNIVIIGLSAYEYRFSRFGNRLILRLTGSELPRIPILTTERELEIIFRRVR